MVLFTFWVEAFKVYVKRERERERERGERERER